MVHRPAADPRRPHHPRMRQQRLSNPASRRHAEARREVWRMTGVLGLLTILVFIAVPISVALGVVPIVFMKLEGLVPLDIVPILIVEGLTDFTFLAVPMFMIMGEIMNRSRIAEDLIEFASAIVGWMKGGLAMVNVGASMVFAEISGSAVADVASEGPIIIPQMVKRGYPKAFAAAITSSSASIAIIIPPSLGLILYGALANESIAKLFIAGVVPGIILGGALMIFCYGFALRYGWPTEGAFSFRRLGQAIRRAGWPLTLPAIILGGIFSGVFTPTEAAAVAVWVALFIAFVVKRSLKLGDLPDIILVSTVRSSVVFLLIATSTILGWYLTNEGIPQAIA
ncbi:MAG: TRAP transporter large permease, partial [Rhodospirillales bacterium]|nr:TRAP transporter large permease [Rhodospirillales bacterium]